MVAAAPFPLPACQEESTEPLDPATTTPTAIATLPPSATVIPSANPDRLPTLIPMPTAATLPILTPLLTPQITSQTPTTQAPATNTPFLTATPIPTLLFRAIPTAVPAPRARILEPTSTPRPTYTPAATPTPTSASTPTPTPTTTAAIAAEAAELAAICSFDEPRRRLSCHAEGQSGGNLKWASNVSSRDPSNDTYEVTLEWGQFVSEIQVQLEECHGLTCSLATTTIDVELQPRGDCPSSFTGWFTTFPLPNLSAIYEVGPPGRIETDNYTSHGYFRVPNGQNVVDVRMPIDATLYEGSVHLERDEPQYLLLFRTACEGLWFLFDHIREPVPAIAELFTDDPPVGDSRTDTVGPLEMKEADLVGTSIGFLEDGNAFVDFGVNDEFGRLPTPRHPNARGRSLSAVCIYTFFHPDTAAYLRSVEHPRLVAEEGLCP